MNRERVFEWHIPTEKIDLASYSTDAGYVCITPIKSLTEKISLLIFVFISFCITTKEPLGDTIREF